MKQSRHIPLYRTFTNWLITVAIGSVFLPFTSLFLGGNGTFSLNHFWDDDMFGLILISMIASALFSVPALLVLFFAHLILNRKSKDMKNHQLIQNCVHLLAALCTFTVMGLSFGKSDQDLLVAIILAYTPVGIVVWNITYMLYKRKKEFTRMNSDVLDEV